MELSIIGPLSNIHYAIQWVEVETNVGNFVIQEGHAPMILLLAKNKEIILFLANGHEEKIMISGGFLEVDRMGITLILDE